jgi:hypothetical protein
MPIAIQNMMAHNATMQAAQFPCSLRQDQGLVNFDINGFSKPKPSKRRSAP